MTPWPIYRGTGIAHDGIGRLPAPPNWRSFDGGPPEIVPDFQDPDTARRLGHQVGIDRVPTEQEINMVNAALFLRRPLLVTGRPGTGKSTLAYLVARELKLGPVLRWPITSRSTLLEGLYRYDAIGRLRDENIRQLHRHAALDGEITKNTARSEQDYEPSPIGKHLRLGPLGTALLPYDQPRVLLIDEIDKSDIDLPNDLLNVFEEGEYVIDELSRMSEEAEVVPVMTADRDGQATIVRGHVRCRAFPLVILTSNDEREFPPAFLRRCLRLDLQPPSPEQVAAIVAAHLGDAAAAAAEDQVDEFLARREHAEIATDQLLNAVYIATSGGRDADAQGDGQELSLDDVVSAILRPISEPE